MSQGMVRSDTFNVVEVDLPQIKTDTDTPPIKSKTESSQKLRKKYTVEWTKESCRTARWILAYGFVFTAFPVYWDQPLMEMGITTNKWHWRRYKLMTALFAFLGIYLPGNLILKIHENGIRTNSFREILSLYNSILPLLLIPFYLHTFWKINQIRTFINAAHSFYEDFQEKYCINRKKAGLEDMLCGFIKFIVLLGGILANFLILGLYVTNCEFHPLSNLFPICSPDGSHVYYMYIFIWGLVLFYGTASLIFSAILYIDISLGSIIFGNYIMKELSVSRNHTRTLDRLRDEGQDWNITYRSLQIVFKLLNECVGEWLLPILLSFFCCGAVLMSFALIKYDMTILYQLTAAGGLFVVLFCNAIFIGQSANVMRLSAEALKSRRKYNRSPILQKFLLSCPLFRVNVGAFFPLKKSTEASVLENILNYTVDALLI